MTAFLCALLIIQQPFSRWPTADQLLLNWQKQAPDEEARILLYRSLLRDRFAPGEQLTSYDNRNFLGLKLFASADEQPSLKEESDRLLA
ncbi:MAG: hypothetical protein ACR2PX_00860, partial [Endozoicomonas sp.]|uniref:hypothetical protein n=1 Tax=Endozoicomonas sp. TaxID=1892382 RepID=UPI003D9B0476